jgi:hypothetical protein
MKVLKEILFRLGGPFKSSFPTVSWYTARYIKPKFRKPNWSSDTGTNPQSKEGTRERNRDNTVDQQSNTDFTIYFNTIGNTMKVCHTANEGR